MAGIYRDNDSGDRLASATSHTFKCSRCGNMYATSESQCDVCGFHCEADTCDIIDSSSEDF